MHERMLSEFNFIAVIGAICCRWFYLGVVVDWKTRIRGATGVSVSDTVSDTDTQWIRHRYVSVEYRKLNKSINFGYLGDT